MKLLFRSFLAAIRALVDRRSLGVLDESVLTFRVWPTDLDFNLHVNNARYLSFMDIGRLDLIGRFRMTRLLMRRRWRPMVGAVMLRFRRGLDPWMRFTVRTRIVGWDEKWFYLEQRFEREGELYALGLVRALFRSSEASVPPSAVLDAFGQPQTSPQLPPVHERWRESLELAGAEPRTLRRLA